MIIKKAKYKKIKVWINKLISEEIHGCDECKSEIKEYPNELSRLVVDVFSHEGTTTHLHFCSWDCVLKHIPKLKSDYFIRLPFMSFDVGKDSKLGANRLIELIKKYNMSK